MLVCTSMESKKTELNGFKSKILIITYYWPPSGGSGVQRWMYFAKYLKKLGYLPFVITVDESRASYPVLDHSLNEEIKDLRVIKTRTFEPLKWYSRIITGDQKIGIPQGEVKTNNLFMKLAAYIRGNFFVPDARKGWINFAYRAAFNLIKEEKIKKIITTGPPHSTHLVGLRLKKYYDFNWWVDLRDPWTDIFYNTSLYRSKKAISKDEKLEKQVIQNANGVITTAGGVLINKLKLKAPNQKFITLPNGYDSRLMKITKSLPKKNGFHIVYTGLLTENQNYTVLLEVLKKLSNYYRICFTIAGNINLNIINEIRSKIPKADFEYLGYLPHSKAVALMKSADLLCNFIFNEAENQMISGKLLEYLATEIPVLCIGSPDTDTSKFLLEATNVCIAKDHEKNIIEDYIKNLLDFEEKPKNKSPNIENWSREEITKRLIKEVLLES